MYAQGIVTRSTPCLRQLFYSNGLAPKGLRQIGFVLKKQLLASYPLAPARSCNSRGAADGAELNEQTFRTSIRDIIQDSKLGTLAPLYYTTAFRNPPRAFQFFSTFAPVPAPIRRAPLHMRFRSRSPSLRASPDSPASILTMLLCVGRVPLGKHGRVRGDGRRSSDHDFCGNQGAW